MQLSQFAKCKLDQANKLKRRIKQCPPKNYHIRSEPDTNIAQPRSELFHRVLVEVKKEVKNENGHGVYSWRAGMKRRNARRIMLRRARAAFRILRETAS